MRTLRAANIPFIDPSVEHVGVSKLRTLNASNLGKVKKTLVIQDNDTPLAVLLTYEQYLILQNKLQEALDTLETMLHPDVQEGLSKGLRDLAEGRMALIEKVDPNLKLS